MTARPEARMHMRQVSYALLLLVFAAGVAWAQAPPAGATQAAATVPAAQPPVPAVQPYTVEAIRGAKRSTEEVKK